MPTTVLFVCVHNAGRSQMAAALLQRYAGERVDVRMGGSEPASDVHPNVVQAMQEIDIDLSAHIPRAFGADDVKEADIVITMGCGDACPLYPGKLYMDWNVEDPKDKGPEDTRRIRADIEWRVQGLVEGVISAKVRKSQLSRSY